MCIRSFYYFSIWLSTCFANMFIRRNTNAAAPHFDIIFIWLRFGFAAAKDWWLFVLLLLFNYVHKCVSVCVCVCVIAIALLYRSFPLGRHWRHHHIVCPICVLRGEIVRTPNGAKRKTRITTTYTIVVCLFLGVTGNWLWSHSLDEYCFNIYIFQLAVRGTAQLSVVGLSKIAHKNHHQPDSRHLFQVKAKMCRTEIVF